MQKEVEEMRRMFDVDEGSWRDGTFWRKERTDIRVGLMRYRVHLWGAGRMIQEFVHVADTNHYIITDKGKNEKATRTIPLFPPVKDALKGKHGMLITNADGTPLTIQGSKRLWDSYVTCMERAINGCSKRWYGKRKQDRDKELPEWQSFTVKPYDLRHSFITWGRDNGVELHTMIEWCGHSDAQMILKIYDEVSSERSNAEAAKLIRKAFRPKNTRRENAD